MSYKIVTFESGNTIGARIFEPGLNSWNDYIMDAKDFNYPFVIYNGNELLSFEDFASFERTFKVYDITEVEAKSIFRLNLDNLGFFPYY